MPGMTIDARKLLSFSRFFGESETSYKTLVETATDAIVVFDSADRVTVWNGAAEKMFGYSRSEAIGSSFIQLAITDEFTDIIKNADRSPATLETDFTIHKSVEIAARRKDGSILPVELALSLHMVAGTWVNTCIMHDLTERKTAEQELIRKNEDLNVLNEELTATQEELRQNIEKLSQNEKQLRETTQYLENLINYANAPIIVWDPEFRIIRFNHAFELLTGITVKDVIGQHIAILFPEKYRFASMDTIRKTVRGEWLNVAEIPILQKSGNVRIVLWNSAPVYQPDGKTISSTIAHGQDITERKKSEDELRQKNDNLIALNKELTVTQEELHQNIEKLCLREQDLSRALVEKEVLLSEIHHRVKNNLTAFISLLSLEGSTEDTPAGKMLKQDLQNRAWSMALIHETLYRTNMFDEVDMGMYLTSLLDQIVNTFKTTRPVKVVVDADGVMLDIQRATPAGLIINELVTNSFKYAFPESFDLSANRNFPPNITIALLKNKGMYELSVRDNGIGLPPGMDLTKTQSLGLKLVNFLAKHQMRANVEVNTTAGTEFVFRFGEETKCGEAKLPPE
jgi:PAS domain S-box-containing protein